MVGNWLIFISHESFKGSDSSSEIYLHFYFNLLKLFRYKLFAATR